MKAKLDALEEKFIEEEAEESTEATDWKEAESTEGEPKEERSSNIQLPQGHKGFTYQDEVDDGECKRHLIGGFDKPSMEEDCASHRCKSEGSGKGGGLACVKHFLATVDRLPGYRRFKARHA